MPGRCLTSPWDTRGVEFREILILTQSSYWGGLNICSHRTTRLVVLSYSLNYHPIKKSSHTHTSHPRPLSMPMFSIGAGIGAGIGASARGFSGSSRAPSGSSRAPSVSTPAPSASTPAPYASTSMALVPYVSTSVSTALSTLALSRQIMEHRDRFLTCRKCGKTYGSKNELFNHLETSNHFEDEPSQPQFTCRKCGEAYGSRNELFNHLETRNHFEDEPSQPQFTCRKCGKAYGSRNQLFNHLETRNHFEDELSQPQFTCRKCGKAYGSRNQLFNHLETSNHFEDEPVPTRSRLDEPSRPAPPSKRNQTTSKPAPPSKPLDKLSPVIATKSLGMFTKRIDWRSSAVRVSFTFKFSGTCTRLRNYMLIQFDLCSRLKRFSKLLPASLNRSRVMANPLKRVHQRHSSSFQRFMKNGGICSRMPSHCMGR